MKVESIFVTDREFLCAVKMFVEEKDCYAGFKLVDTKSIDVESFIVENHYSYVTEEDINAIKDFVAAHEGWVVYVMKSCNEVCGLVAFDDWD